MSTPPNDPDGPQLRDHEYDGIQEYDQKLPNWWLFTLYGAIAFFAFYWLAYYQLDFMSTDEDAIAASMAKIDEARAKQLDSLDDQKLWAMSRDPNVVAVGQATFQATCVACHGPDLSGTLSGVKLPGLPLTDQEWKHGGLPSNVLKTVRKGSPDLSKGMPAWEPLLGIKRTVEVVAFIMSHHQEGEPITRAADSPPLVAAPR